MIRQKPKNCLNLTIIINSCRPYSIVVACFCLTYFTYSKNSNFAYADSAGITSATIEILNNVRNTHSLDPLLADYQLIIAAKAHAKFLSKEKRLTHIGKGSKTLGQRLQDVNFDFNQAGENLASSSSSIHDVIYQWLSSDRHRENILYSNYTHVGVGIAQSERTYYWVLIFASKSDRLLKLPE